MVSLLGLLRWTEDRGQGTIEFAFALITFLFLVYGMVQAARWVVMDTIERRVQYENSLMINAAADIQLNPRAIKGTRPDLERRWKPE